MIFCFFFIKEKEREKGTQFLIKKCTIKEAWFTKANLRLPILRSFVLKQKEPKVQECRIASGRHSALRAWVATLKVVILQTALYDGFLFICPMLLLPPIFQLLKYRVCRAAGQVTTQVRLPGKTPGGDWVCLDFLFLFHQGKRKRKGNAVPDQKMYDKRSMVYKSKPAVADTSFFCLETKEPKIQECRIASGRHSAHRSWVATLKVPILQAAFHS